MALDPHTHVGSVTLRVGELGRELALYEGALGLISQATPGGVAELRSADGPVLLRLVESPGAPPPPPNAAGLFHTALRWPTRAGLADALRRVVSAGFRLTGASDHGVSEALYLDDPEGNGVELYWDRARDQWPHDQAGNLRMYTAPLDVRGLVAAAAGDDAPPGGVDVGHVHLKSTDIGRSVGFWSGALGLDLMAQMGDQAAFMSAGGYHHHIGANTWHSRGGPPAPEDALGLARVTLRLPDAAAVQDAAAGLRAAGVEVQDGSGGAVLARDPDGVAVELTAGAGGGAERGAVGVRHAG